ncbi:endonuclease/exonuclease/phosphatase family protein [Oligoflexus tunisiensis]|uniref:endonuclease/exonuclease/phosphatase family protein n=1 Tax=Oligoflexus tunisiensis TaxID=708132 RepID=UPI00114D0CF7|nr:endonuclease/exonuclease/phosphatase family protein [Oligoflexus tunisiensis]
MDSQKASPRFVGRLILTTLFAPFLMGTKPVPEAKHPEPEPPAPLFVMSYNVENLFDTEHDEGKDDWTYLPLDRKKTADHKKRCAEVGGSKQRSRECETLDWSETELKTKLGRIGKILTSVNKGQCADVLILVEIENLKVLERLRTEFLSACKYKPGILLEGNDRRGIDTAILSRLELTGAPRLHAIDFVESRRNGETPRSRDLLEASFKLASGEILTAFAIHFPAPYHPFIERLEAMRTLNKAAQKAAEQAHVVIAAGDFNINAKEDSRFYRAVASLDWQVSHLEGCRTCLGTHYFKRDDSWSFLDAIMVSKHGRKHPHWQWTLDPASVALVQGFDFQTDAKGLPIGWERATLPGQSDHLPITLQLKAVPRKK